MKFIQCNSLRIPKSTVQSSCPVIFNQLIDRQSIARTTKLHVVAWACEAAIRLQCRYATCVEAVSTVAFRSVLGTPLCTILISRVLGWKSLGVRAKAVAQVVHRGHGTLFYGDSNGEWVVELTYLNPAQRSLQYSFVIDVLFQNVPLLSARILLSASV